MADDETLLRAYDTNTPIYRMTSGDSETVIRAYDTGTPIYKLDGEIGGGGTAKAMTTEEREAYTPAEGEMIYDTDEGALYVGDGVTAGGLPVGSGGGGGGGTPATVTDIMTGSGESKILNVRNIRGALTAGQAVDVTSCPDDASERDWRGTFPWSYLTLGFASFPKFASGLKYLMIADLTPYWDSTVTPGGTWIDGTTSAITLTAGTAKRVAMLFDTVDGGMFNFSTTGGVTVTHLREYEVTSCSSEAINYIAALSNPDAFSDYYLVKADMVQPWTNIIDMGTSPAVTIASGLSYKLSAITGVHELSVDTCPAGYNGRDASIRITHGATGLIQVVPPLQLGNALTPYAINNCVVRYRDGEAILLVEDTLAGYIVTVTSGTDEGSLPYGLASANTPYIAFNPSTDGTTIDLSGATASAEEKMVVGNGYTSTTLTGSVHCGDSDFLAANLALLDVAIIGGIMTLGDIAIPSGSTVAVSGGGLAIERASGGGVIDLGGATNVTVASGTTASVMGAVITNGSATGQGGAFYTSNGVVDLTGCVISGNVATGNGGAMFVIGTSAIATLSGCSVYGNNTSGQGGGLVASNGASVNVVSSVISGAAASNDLQIGNNTVVTLSGSTIGNCILNGTTGSFVFTESNTINDIRPRNASQKGAVVISSGASITLTSSINPNSSGGISVVGGTCHVNGTLIESGTYTTIDSNGSAAV